MGDRASGWAPYSQQARISLCVFALWCMEVILAGARWPRGRCAGSPPPPQLAVPRGLAEPHPICPCRAMLGTTASGTRACSTTATLRRWWVQLFCLCVLMLNCRNVETLMGAAGRSTYG